MRLVKKPRDCKRRRRVLKWERRACWLRVCVRCKMKETRSRWAVRVWASKESVVISAVAASRTWLKVTAGFFPPQPLGLAGQEQMANDRDVPVAHQSLILANLEMREAQLAFLILQSAFDRPACESNVQPGFELVFERIPDEEPFFFVRVQRVVSPQELVAREDVTIAPQPKRRRLDLPHQRSFFRVLDVPGSPRLARQRPGVMTQFLDATRRLTGRVAGMGEPPPVNSVEFPRRSDSGAAPGRRGKRA